MGLGIAVKLLYTVSILMVSAPILKLVQPVLSVKTSLGTYIPGVMYRWEMVSRREALEVLPSAKSHTSVMTWLKTARKCTGKGLQPESGV
jgi:hypothetical protein